MRKEKKRFLMKSESSFSSHSLKEREWACSTAESFQSHYLILVLRQSLTIYPRLAWNLQSSCLNVRSLGVWGIYQPVGGYMLESAQRPFSWEQEACLTISCDGSEKWGAAVQVFCCSQVLTCPQKHWLWRTGLRNVSLSVFSEVRSPGRVLWALAFSIFSVGDRK